MSLSYTDVNDAFPALLHRVLTQGHKVDSRNGKTLELTMEQITLNDPRVKELVLPGRRVSLPAQIAETMWILSGSNDAQWLSHYLPRALDFSDDGKTWRGGYGPRLRGFRDVDNVNGVDQLDHIVELLKQDPETRRAVFSIYDPAVDIYPGKDIPCNNWVHFLPREGTLHAHVAIRSNDLFWGWSGINAFEWTSLLQIVANLTGLQRGSITFSTSSLHLYERHWKKAEELVNNWTSDFATQPRQGGPEFNLGGLGKGSGGSVIGELDDLIARWFKLEGQIRKGGLSTALLHQIATFPEPMFKSWLFVLLAWHHDDTQLMKQYRGTALYEAAASSPKYKGAVKATTVQKGADAKEYKRDSKWSNERAAFTEFANNLHMEKNAAYGNSWMKRGEMLGIMANCARKVDRLGVSGGGDTAADTAIDLMMYFIKYDLWLEQQKHADWQITEGQEHIEAVKNYLEMFEHGNVAMDDLPDDVLISEIRSMFDRLEVMVEEKQYDRDAQVKLLAIRAYPLAVRLWAQEEREKNNAEGIAMDAFLNRKQPVPSHAERNAHRAFNGYAQPELDLS